MDYQGKDCTQMTCYAVESKYGLDGKMPGTCSVGGWHQYGKAACYEGYEGAGGTEVGGEVKTLECYVEVKIVTEPYTDAVCQEQGEAFYFAYAEHSFFEVCKPIADLPEDT